MATRKSDTRKLTAAEDRAAVDSFMQSLSHPHKPAIEVLRRLICSADHRIAEGIKWNAPSFHSHEYFATVHLRAKEGIGLILHLGAKARAGEMAPIADPDALLTWLGKDRAMVSFADADEVHAKSRALTAILKQWLEQV